MLTEKNQVVPPVFLPNENPNSECNLSSANNENISKAKISTVNEHQRTNSSLLAKENNKDDEKEKPKLKNSVVKKTLVLGDSIILNRKMKFIVSVRSFMVLQQRQ